MLALGMHTLADYWHCEQLSPAAWEQLVRDAVDAAGATLVDFRFKEFQPQGFTALALVYARKLVARNPNEQAAQQLLESLR